ncbi:nitroreductase family protein [Nonlabens marinus]|uniref:Putative NAD(P)H nitroreductase n=1 Tax=Nonlabens marinus S1-08 TaxID=1454201 RepID=W8VXJ0_9FLAO|nr:nitroreductase [Nonlabens marinus]BAO56012.1 nitroreductase family protein [Nonlabens marinus S1-08]
MQTLLQKIQQRRSIFPKDYTGDAVSSEHMDQILEAARWAPTHKKTQPWKYKVFQGNGLKQLGDFMTAQFVKDSGKAESFKSRKLAEKMQQSSAVVLIFLNRQIKESLPEWEEVAAVSMSVQNMWLTAHDLGYGCYWSSPKSFAKMQEFEAIDLESNDQFLGFLYIGTVDSQPEELPKRKSVEEFVQFIN